MGTPNNAENERNHAFDVANDGDCQETWRNHPAG